MLPHLHIWNLFFRRAFQILDCTGMGYLSIKEVCGNAWVFFLHLSNFPTIWIQAIFLQNRFFSRVRFLKYLSLWIFSLSIGFLIAVHVRKVSSLILDPQVMVGLLTVNSLLMQSDKLSGAIHPLTRPLWCDAMRTSVWRRVAIICTKIEARSKPLVKIILSNDNFPSFKESLICPPLLYFFLM